jgi:hypothetical protein
LAGKHTAQNLERYQRFDFFVASSFLFTTAFYDNHNEMAPDMKYWNDTQPSWAAPGYGSEDEDDVDDGSDMSEWASENEEQTFNRPVFKSKTEGLLDQYEQ